MTPQPRARTRTTATAKIREWRLPLRIVQEIRSLYGLPTYFLVVEPLPNGAQLIRSRHRKKSAAFKAAAKQPPCTKKGK